MYLFGSVARGEDTPNSDVDICVEMDIDVFNGTRQQFNDYVRENGVK